MERQTSQKLWNAIWVKIDGTPNEFKMSDKCIDSF
jgi:hypothetical protein